MRGYIDMHCHILPGVDDGAKDIEEMKEMLKIAYQEGIRCIIATPHYHPRRGKEKPEILIEQAILLRDTAHAIDENFRIYLGTEIYFGQDVIQKLKEKQIMTMNRRNYVLVEFSTAETFSYIQQSLQQLQFSGYEVILAHVERYGCITDNPELAMQLWEMGIHLQINAGSNVNITEGVTILTHGYDWSVLKVKYGDVLGSAGKVAIGNNVFIGMNTTILKGVTVGDNCIIGAGSVLTSGKVYPENSVIVGNPARVIGNVDAYREKMIGRQLSEAVECYKCYKEVFNIIPPREIFREFFWLFQERDESKLCDAFVDIMHLEGNFDQSLRKWCDSKPSFGSYEEFVSYCEKRTKS